jgi:hypothetical protein
VNRPVESSNLGWNRRLFAERLPESLLPIACDSGGNPFCLKLTGPDAGAITYVDFDRSEPESHFVAPNITALLEKLRPEGSAIPDGA